MDVFQLLKRHEGERLKPYCDRCGVEIFNDGYGWICQCAQNQQVPGNMTIGVGRNLTSRGVLQSESDNMVSHDITDVLIHLRGFPWYSRLDPVRQAAMIDLAFNVGIHGFDEFESMKTAMANADYAAAAYQLRCSNAQVQEPRRIEELARMLESGEWPQGQY